MKENWDVMCNVDKIVIDVSNKTGYLYLPENNVPDMRSTIECFTSVDPKCNTVYTFIGGKADTTYIKHDKWEAFDGRGTD